MFFRCLAVAGTVCSLKKSNNHLVWEHSFMSCSTLPFYWQRESCHAIVFFFIQELIKEDLYVQFQLRGGSQISFERINTNWFSQLLFQLTPVIPNRCDSTASPLLSIPKENFNCSSPGELLPTPFRARKTRRRTSKKVSSLLLSPQLYGR